MTGEDAGDLAAAGTSAVAGGRDPGTGYRGNQPRGTVELAAWLEGAPEEAVVEPDLPIVDPHHHLFGSSGDRLLYELDDLRRDLDSGHRVIGTVYIEAYESGWRETGPEEMRPVGETEKIVALTCAPVSTRAGDCRVAAGIVCFADLTLGERVAGVLEAHSAAADGRLRGLRHRTATVGGEIGRVVPGQPRPGLLADPDFRRGFAQLAPAGLSFDAWIHHHQIGELVALADAFPDTVIIIDHIAGPIGVAEFAARQPEVTREWEDGLRALAARPNTRMKLGGMGMPVMGFGFERRDAPPTGAELAETWQPRIDLCVDVFGADRCMFESNFPVDKQSAGHRATWNAFKLATRNRSASERRDLFHRSACRIYRLPELEALADRILPA